MLSCPVTPQGNQSRYSRSTPGLARSVQGLLKQVAALCSILGLIACTSSAQVGSPPETRPKDSSVELFSKGRSAAEQGDTVRAEQYLTMALEQGFDQKKILPLMLKVCLSSSRLRSALNHAEPYLREHPRDQGLRYLVATIHLGLGQVNEARIDLHHLLQQSPANADALYLLGVLESGINGEAAARYFRRYLELDPQGEHAAESQSRLTDLSVRASLKAGTGDSFEASGSPGSVSWFDEQRSDNLQDAP